VALVIFSTIVLGWISSCDGALEAAREANMLRMLRMLSARKIAEVLARTTAFQDGDGAETSFDADQTLPPGETSPLRDYFYKVESEEVVAAGYSADEDTSFLFDRDREAAAPAVPQGAKPPDPIKLLRFTITVSYKPDGAEEVLEMKAMTYAPLPEEPVAGGGSGGGGGPPR